MYSKLIDVNFPHHREHTILLSSGLCCCFLESVLRFNCHSFQGNFLYIYIFTVYIQDFSTCFCDSEVYYICLDMILFLFILLRTGGYTYTRKLIYLWNSWNFTEIVFSNFVVYTFFSDLSSWYVYLKMQGLLIHSLNGVFIFISLLSFSTASYASALNLSFSSLILSLATCNFLLTLILNFNDHIFHL